MRKVLIVLLCVTFGCLNQKLEELEFLEVHTEPPAAKPVDIGQLALVGRLGTPSSAAIKACGFAWSESADSLFTCPACLRTIPADPPVAGELSFQAPFQIKQGQTIFFRAFAQFEKTGLGVRTVWAEEVESSKLDDIVRMTDKPTRITNDTAFVWGELKGLIALSEDVLAHGHVFSSENQLPAIASMDCDSTNLGGRNDDGFFVSKIKGLRFNTTYHVRAYCISQDHRVFYSEKTDTFRVKDGWTYVGIFQGFQDGAAIGVNGKAYAGFGCNNIGTCPANDISNEFWQFDGQNSWQLVAPFPGAPQGFGFRRTNTSVFTIGDTIYTIFGERNPTGSGSGLSAVTDFWKYAIGSNQWVPGQFPSDTLFRSGATGFVLNGKIYVGTGRYYPGGSKKYRNDFWEYDPLSSIWRPVADLPLRYSETDLQNSYNLGRSEAAGFACEETGYGYVVGGEYAGIPLRDCWRFTPPSMSPDTLGHWDLAGFFPGPGRTDAVYFTIGKQAYYGTGYNLTEGYLSDFWEFDLSLEQWQERTPFQGGWRRQALGFSIGESGYLGTGLSIEKNINGQGFDEKIKSDIWRYIPINQ